MNMNSPTEPEDSADVELVEDLRRIGRDRDPVPPNVVAGAKALFTWRTIDAELAELTFDSVETGAELVGVRGADTIRLLTFEASTLTVELEVHPTGDRRRLVGQLVPAAPAIVEVRHGAGTAEVETDELGRFAVDGIAAGPIRLDVRAADQPGPAVSTSWVSV
jgi:hypothetical protein